MKAEVINGLKNKTKKKKQAKQQNQTQAIKLIIL